ncbi:MAG: hypothetical protein HFI69_00585 [Lachnospiraceae bacterium]|nr:hypothetical protein [Lachnospiraceae bacterium]
MTVLLIILLAAVGYILWQKWELTKFQVTTCQIRSPKLQKQASAVVIADLHGFSYGRENNRLLQQIRSINPHVILIAGDMLVSKYEKTYQTAWKTLAELVKIAPVYYGYGNHESRLKDPERLNHLPFLQYIKQVQELGVHVLETESRQVSLGENQVMLSALELEMTYYEKGRIVPMEPSYIKDRLGGPEEEMFQILLAHNPAYAEYYAQWGADVTFCGHNHGGLIRIPGIGSVISPQYTLFPKYDAGDLRFGNRHVIVSRGLGTHTFHVRIFNRAELLEIKFLPENS